MDKKISRKDYIEIKYLVDRIVDAYSQKDVANDIKRLNFLSNVIDTSPYYRGVLGELTSYAAEAAKHKEYGTKAKWTESAKQTLIKLEMMCVEVEVSDD